MITYKLTVNLDATLAVQNENGSFNYFKPSVGAEITTDEMDDLEQLAKKFEELYSGVIAPNFSSVVTEFIINSGETDSTESSDNGCESGDGDCSGNGESQDELVDSAEDTANKNNTLVKEEWE